MAVRLARGLFRLWLVLSVPWIGGWALRRRERPRYPKDVNVRSILTHIWLASRRKKAALGLNGSKPRSSWRLFRTTSILRCCHRSLCWRSGWALVWALRGFGDEPKV